MSEYGEIVSTIGRIMWAVDHQDRELFRDCWSEDVDFEVTFFGQAPLAVRGRAELVSKFTADWASRPSDLRHQLGAVAIDALDDGKARARFYCTYVRVGETAVLAGMGEYEDELVRSGDGVWRVARRRHRFLTPLAH